MVNCQSIWVNENMTAMLSKRSPRNTYSCCVTLRYEWVSTKGYYLFYVLFRRESLRNVYKNRGALAEPSFLQMNPFVSWTCFGSVMAGKSFNISLRVPLLLATLYPKNSFIEITRHRRSSLYGSGIAHFILNCPILPFGIVANDRSYASFGQPFSKQLYADVRSNTWINLVKRIWICK